MFYTSKNIKSSETIGYINNGEVICNKCINEEYSKEGPVFTSSVEENSFSCGICHDQN